MIPCVVNSNVISSTDDRPPLIEKEVKTRIDQLSELRFGPNITPNGLTRLLALLVKFYEVFSMG